MNNKIKIVIGDWASCKEAAAAVRHDVFVLEQNVPKELEMDALDADCVHAVAYDGQGVAVGTGRLLPDAHIGRMAVRSDYRGKGVGSKLLQALIDEARRRKHMEVVLSAQVHAQDFYAAHGFVAEGRIYMDAGIEHVVMRHALTA